MRGIVTKPCLLGLGIGTSQTAGCPLYLLTSPIRARYFSLLRQRKVPKRKAIPEACPLRGSPALLVKAGARATRYAQTGRERHPALTAMLGCVRRGKSQNQHQHLKPAAPTRLHSLSTTATPGTRRAPCLSESSSARSRVVRAPGVARNGRNRRSR